MLTKAERKKLIIDNIYLVKNISLIYSKKTGIDASELESYGYEGLIEVVDNFNNLTSYVFLRYMHKYIRSSIESGIRIIKPRYYYENIAKKNINLLSYKLKNKIYLNEVDSITQYNNNLISDDDEVFYNASQSLINMELYKSLDCLTPDQKRIIIDRYGLEDGYNKTFEEIGEKYCSSRQNIQRIEAIALNKLRNLAINTKKLKSLIEIYDQHNENNYTQYQMIKK